MANISGLLSGDFAVTFLIGLGSGITISGIVYAIRAAVKLFGRIIKS